MYVDEPVMQLAMALFQGFVCKTKGFLAKVTERALETLDGIRKS